MSNYTIPPRLKPSDYAKGKITQDELIALQIANDANIASARKAIKMGEPPQLTPINSLSPDELLADDAAQEAAARSNLMRLGFRDQEAAAIITTIRSDGDLDFTTLNANFPAIETDVKSKFNPRLLTPTFFVEYLKQYNQELLATKGVTNGGLATISRNINALINSVAEIRLILPEPVQMTTLLRNVDRIRRSTERGALLEPIMERIAVLETALPTPVDYARIEALNAVDRNQILQALQTATADLPSKAQVDTLIRQMEAGNRGSIERLEALADSVDNGMRRRLEDILKDVREVGDLQQEVLSRVERQATTPARGKQEWDGTYPIDLETFTNLYADMRGKTKYLKFAIDRGDLTGFSKGDIDDLSSRKMDTLFENELSDVVVGLSAVGKEPAGKSSASATSMTSGETPSGVGGLFGSKGGFGIRPEPRPAYRPIKVGKGIAVKQTPSYKEYGKYAIHIPQLEQQDILNVKYKSLGQIPKFKPIPVSDVFRDFIIDLLENGKPNARVYTQIEPKERKFFEEMSIGAGVWNGLGLKRTTTSTDEEENKRFELLKGEYIAGNNNPKVISELRRLVVKMISDGRIRKNQGVELLMELSI